MSFAQPVFVFSDLFCTGYTLIPTAAFALQPSTTYWLRIRGNVPSEGGGLGWCASNPPQPYVGIATSAGKRHDFSDPPTGNISAGAPSEALTYAVNAPVSVVEVPAVGPWGAAALVLALGATAFDRLRRRGSRPS